MVTMTRRLFVTGAAGQLGTAVQQVASRGDAPLTVTPLTSADFDIADSESVRSALSGLSADDIVLNCVAYTDVDGAEEDHSGAHAVNVDGPAHLVRVTKEKGAWLIHISTDYVFSGTPPRVADVEGYEPGDVGPDDTPATVYGRTKLRGENVVLRGDPSSTIVRTAWLYTGGPDARDFVGTMRRLEAQRDAVNVVSDQTGSPTYARDLATGLLELAGRGRLAIDLAPGDGRQAGHCRVGAKARLLLGDRDHCAEVLGGGGDRLRGQRRIQVGGPAGAVVEAARKRAQQRLARLAGPHALRRRRRPSHRP